MLMMTERQGVEIDYCPKCRGVWLDRGELDKILERTEGGSGSRGTGAAARSSSAPPAQPPAHGGPRKLDDSDYGYTYTDPHGQPYKKRKSLLRELLDFD
jgi:Zn-finger nucleic acid-binding protein